MSDRDLELKLEKIRLLEQKLELKEGLPHLYGFQYYPWQRQYLMSPNRMTLVCAANQIGKSTIQWLKCITLATSPDLWPKFWNSEPRVFWYIYPNRNTATSEFDNKVLLDYLPKGKFKDHPQYGWTAEYKNKEIFAIHFNSGVTLYFKTWGVDLQSSTIHAAFVDEELPQELYSEIALRLARFSGIFSMVFTATLNQPFWYDAIERKGQKGERFSSADKWQVSMYDCLYFEDGSPSHLTEEKINQIINTCGTDNEVLRRVYGRFVSEEGLKVPSFSRDKNILREPPPVPEDYLWFSGVDVGSGGQTGHPPAIAFIAVKPDYTYGRVVRCWRGTRIQNYTATDILEKYIEMRADRQMSGEYYDWQAADFFTVSSRAGVPFQKAEKSHEIGFPMMNTLFKNGMLVIDDTEENQDLVTELVSLRSTTKKTVALDDATDSTRYGISKIPWDFSHISGDRIIVVDKKPLTHDEERAKRAKWIENDDDVWDVSGEFEDANEMYDV